MLTVSVVDHQSSSPGYGAPFSVSDGNCSSAFADFSDGGMWALRGTLDPDSSIQWGPVHGDEVVYVVDGLVEVDDGSRESPSTCGPETAIVIESGAPLAIRAVSTTTVWHCGASSPEQYVDGPLRQPFVARHGVHVVPRADAQELVHRRADGTATTSTYYADGVCRTCRIAFFKNGSPTALSAPSHSHSQNEVIHVTTGELRIGNVTVPTGASVFVPADTRYSFRTPGAWEFLNFRRGLAYYVGHPRDEPRLETWDGLAYLSDATRR